MHEVFNYILQTGYMSLVSCCRYCLCHALIKNFFPQRCDHPKTLSVHVSIQKEFPLHNSCIIPCRPLHPSILYTCFTLLSLTGGAGNPAFDEREAGYAFDTSTAHHRDTQCQKQAFLSALTTTVSLKSSVLSPRVPVVAFRLDALFAAIMITSVFVALSWTGDLYRIAL